MEFCSNFVEVLSSIIKYFRGYLIHQLSSAFLIGLRKGRPFDCSREAQ